MTPGRQFDVLTLGAGSCVVWYTMGDPLPVGVAADFGFTPYCAPCRHS